MNIKNTLNLVYIRIGMTNKKNIILSLMLITLSTILLKSGIEVMATPYIDPRGSGSVPP